MYEAEHRLARVENGPNIWMHLHGKLKLAEQRSVLRVSIEEKRGLILIADWRVTIQLELPQHRYGHSWRSDKRFIYLRLSQWRKGIPVLCFYLLQSAKG